MGRKKLELSDDEILVLGHWLHRFNRSADAAFADQAEQRCLWDLEAMIERKSDVLLSPDYDKRLAAARERLRDDFE